MALRARLQGTGHRGQVIELATNNVDVVVQLTATM
jgi:hypothetical protein